MTKIYAIVSPENGDYVYIGKTTQDCADRLLQHKYYWHDLSEWIKNQEELPEVKILATVEDDISDMVERKMISKYCDQAIFNIQHNPNKKAIGDIEFLNSLKKFLKTHTAISLSGISREAGISPRYLTMILNEERNMTEATKGKLLPVIKKYGY